MRGATNKNTEYNSAKTEISIHAPHAGRDITGFMHRLSAFNISIHAPHAGRDQKPNTNTGSSRISIHAPHAGRDQQKQ